MDNRGNVKDVESIGFSERPLAQRPQVGLQTGGRSWPKIVAFTFIWRSSAHLLIRRQPHERNGVDGFRPEKKDIRALSSSFRFLFIWKKKMENKNRIFLKIFLKKNETHRSIYLSSCSEWSLDGDACKAGKGQNFWKKWQIRWLIQGSRDYAGQSDRPTFPVFLLLSWVAEHLSLQDHWIDFTLYVRPMNGVVLSSFFSVEMKKMARWSDSLVSVAPHLFGGKKSSTVEWNTA